MVQVWQVSKSGPYFGSLWGCDFFTPIHSKLHGHCDLILCIITIELLLTFIIIKVFLDQVKSYKLLLFFCAKGQVLPTRYKMHATFCCYWPRSELLVTFTDFQADLPCYRGYNFVWVWADSSYYRYCYCVIFPGHVNCTLFKNYIPTVDLHILTFSGCKIKSEVYLLSQKWFKLEIPCITPFLWLAIWIIRTNRDSFTATSSCLWCFILGFFATRKNCGLWLSILVTE